VLVLEVVGGTFVHRVRIWRDDGDAARSERPHRAAHRLRRGDRRNARTVAHPPGHGVVVIIGEETRRSLRQDHQLDLGGAEQPRLIVDVLVAARREGPAGRARHQSPDMRLVGRRQQPAFDLNRRVGRWN